MKPTALIRQVWQEHKHWLLVLIGLPLAYWLGTTSSKEHISDLESQAQILITEQSGVIATIAEITARNGADAITESIIRDCSLSERSRFDELLSTLNVGLTKTQLIELERLFGRCGDFYAARKSVMVSRLTREIELYETFVGQLSSLKNKDLADEFQVSEWNALALLEQKQSELFSKLVVVQDNIISTLLTGKNPISEDVQTILQEAREIQETLAVTNKQAAEARSKLVNL